MNLLWTKYVNGNYCELELVDLSEVKTKGVYVIWHGTRGNAVKPAVVRVGQGDIASRLTEHRNNMKILAYRSNGLYVTWAEVPPRYLDGVERYLADTWRPLVGDAFPDVTPIAVNSPWG